MVKVNPVKIKKSGKKTKPERKSPTLFGKKDYSDLTDEKHHKVKKTKPSPFNREKDKPKKPNPNIKLKNKKQYPPTVNDKPKQQRQPVNAVRVVSSKSPTANRKKAVVNKGMRKNDTVSAQRTASTRPSKRRGFQYTKTVPHGDTKLEKRSVELQEVKNEKVLTRRAKLETVRDLNEVSFLEKINLVSYFNQKESGKLDERIVRQEYLKNTATLQKGNSLKYFLLESARRNLEYGEFPEIKVQIDPRMKDELYECLDSKLLASYDIKVERQHEILTKMNVDPIIISMRLKVIS